MLSLLFLLAGASGARAAPFQFFGYDTASIGVANSNVAYGDSYGVLFTNPALMSRFEPQTSVGLIVYVPRLSIDLMDRPQNADVSMAYYDTNVSMYQFIPDRPIPTVELKTQRHDNRVNDPVAYLTTGFTYDFDVPGFRIGALTVIPLVEVLQISTHYFDEREQYYTNTVHYARFGEWSPIIGGIVGASYSPIQYLSLGLSLQVSVGLVAAMGLYIPEATVQEYGLMNVSETKAVVKFRPIVGVQVEPTEWMSLGLNWRNESYVRTDATGHLDLWNYHENSLDQTVPRYVVQNYDLALDYEPMELTLALGFQYAGWRVQGGATWSRWSNYIDDHAQSPQDSAARPPVNPGDPLIDGDDYAWRDTFSTNIGASYRYAEWGEGRLGFVYSPSPVPDQRGRTNFADGHLWCVAAGNRFTLPVFDKRLTIDLGFQFWRLVQRTVYKDPLQIRDEFPDGSLTILQNTPVTAAEGLQTNNAGFPGYTQKGYLIVTSASVGLEF